MIQTDDSIRRTAVRAETIAALLKTEGAPPVDRKELAAIHEELAAFARMATQRWKSSLT